jgi:NADH-quinone oxidoreductase subunit N
MIPLELVLNANLYILTVSMVLAVPALLIPFLSSLAKGKAKNVGWIMTLIALFLATTISLAILPKLSRLPLSKPDSSPFIIDWFSLIIIMTALISGIVVMVGFNGKRRYIDIFSSFVLFSIVGTILLSTAVDVAVIIASWALVSVSSYALAAVMKDPDSLRNSIKYAIMGGVASQFLILAFLFLFATTGSLSLYPFTLSNIYFVLVALLFLLVAVGFKAGIAPFHMWLPDVYGYAHPMAVAALSSIAKLGAIALVIRAVYYFVTSTGAEIFFTSTGLAAISAIAIVSMFLGNLAALTQRNVQRMMAYSSIAHVGYILIALAVIPMALTYGQESSLYMAVAGAVLHIVAYSVAKAGIFTSIDMLSSKNHRALIERFEGLAARNPAAAAGISVLLLNFIGVPPLPGFWSKLLLFASAANPNIPQLMWYGIPWLTLIGILNSVISVFYYAKVMIIMYWKPSRFEEAYPYHSGIAIALSSITLVVVGIAVIPYLTSILI